MKVSSLSVLLLCVASPLLSQTQTHDVTPGELQTILNLPLSQAVQQRETYKVPVRAAYTREMLDAGKDCEAEAKTGQQPYNICMGHASTQAAQDYATFYNNLQMLCHDQAQLTALQSTEKVWNQYKSSAIQAAHAAWPDGTGAPGFQDEVYLSLVRDHMRELHEIYGLNIAQ